MIRVCRNVSLLGLAVALGGCGAGLTAKKTPASASKNQEAPAEKNNESSAAKKAMKRGEFARARTLLERKSGLGAKSAKKNAERETLLSELLLLTGEYEELLQRSSTSPAVHLIKVLALRRVGRVEEAIALASSIQGDEAESAESRFLEGDLLRETGQKEKAATLFEKVIAMGQGIEESKLSASMQMRVLLAAGRSAHALRKPELANELFNRAEQTGATSVDLLRHRADLYLEKHDTAHALEVYEEAAELWPTHPEVLLLEARIGLEAALAFAEAERLAKKVLAINPRSSGARFVLAGVEMRVLNFEAARRHIEEGLKTNSRDLKLLSMQATERFLAEDPNGFEALVEKVLKLSPGYSELFRVVGNYAEWEHRYPDIQKLMRRASRIDREDGQVRALLGLTLVRAGSDAAGIVELNRAYDLDPFDVRVINTLKLYEKSIPKLYEDHRKGPFKYRFPKAEAALLKRYVPDLLEEAFAEMVERYGLTPRAPIGIEIYSSRGEFSVRTSGLPQIAIAGVCFGRKLATMSPIGSPGNLGMTLWHELAHVFHLELSKNRVPRFLTEGMAEWETARRGIGWSREQDLRLEKALRIDALPPLNQMTRAFTHARHMEDVATAYYASGLLAEWIVESRGEQAAVNVLRELGKKRLAPEVMNEVLGAPAALNLEFRAFLDKEVDRFKQTFVFELVREPAEDLEKKLKSDKKNLRLKTRFGVASLQEGDLKTAEKVLSEVAKVDKGANRHQAEFALARIELATQKKKAAHARLTSMLKETDGYEIRMVLARTALALKKSEGSVAHLEAAHRLDPKAEEPLSLLAAIHHRAEESGLELDAVRKWAKLSEHDPVVHRRLIEMLLEREEFAEAAKVADLALWTDLAGQETHRLAGLAFARSGNWKRAEFEWETALLVPTTLAGETQLEKTWVEELKRRGQGARAEIRASQLREGRAARLRQSSGSK